MSEGGSPPSQEGSPLSHGYGTFTPEEDNITQVSAETNSLTSGVWVDDLRVVIDRDVLTQDSLRKLAEDSQQSERFCTSEPLETKRGCCQKWKRTLASFFPLIGWLSTYNVKQCLLTDVMAGFTLGVMQVPQGMAYAMLAGVAPVVGLYTSFYPVLVYFFLGTSKQASIGTFALISMLTRSAMDDVLRAHRGFPAIPITNVTESNSEPLTENSEETADLQALEAAVVVAMLVGIMELVMSLTRMGSLTVLMSDHMVSGLITGTALQVLTSQVPSLTGATVNRHSGAFNVIYTWVDFFHFLKTVRIETVLVSLCSLIFLAILKALVDPPCKKKFRLPFPAELILIIVATAMSQQFSFKEKHDIAVIGPIPTGLVGPKLPRLDLVPGLLTGSVVISVVGVSLSLSIVMAYAKKHDYAYDANQELLAYGASNLVGSFFACIPCSVSLSRSAVLDSSGAKSQLSTLVSCGLLLIVILALGPLFQNLPDAVLSAIIVVALRSMLLGVKDFFASWRTSKTEAMVWLVTFLGVLVLDIDYGLALGVVFSLATVVYRSQHPEVRRLGHVPGTELYRDPLRYPSAREIPGVRIVHFAGALYFGNREELRTQVISMLDSGRRTKVHKMEEQKLQDHDFEKSWCSMMKDSVNMSISRQSQRAPIAHHVVLSCSGIPFVDSEGAQAILQLVRDCQSRHVQIYFASLQDCVLETLVINGFWQTVPREFVYPTVHDAVLAAVDATVNSDNIFQF